jgi:hypothetical protein
METRGRLLSLDCGWPTDPGLVLDLDASIVLGQSEKKSPSKTCSC